MAESLLTADLEHQKALIAEGSAYIKLLRPATVGGGIYRFDAAKSAELVQRFDEAREKLQTLKFVPASGAATRMFKEIYAWIADPEPNKAEIDAFFNKVEDFPFFDEWMQAADKADLETFEAGLKSKVSWLSLLVDPNALGFAQRPKGLIPFHRYDEVIQTPVVEHLKEGMAYASHDGKVQINFTVSPEHEEAFRQEVDHWVQQAPFDAVEWSVTFTHQDAATDTIALDEVGDILTSGAGEPLLRPGGHGALIHNLNAIDADLVFIKNIDNVAHERLLDRTVEHKKLLAGLLLAFRADLKSLHTDLQKGLVDEQLINDLREKWGLRIPRDYRKLRAYINRPIRVCGMVKNEGEPGGGPFWTLDKHTGESLQIVEKAQIDPKDSRQQRIAEGATHFNPVDLVCYLKNMDDEPIELLDYVADEQYFTVEKTFEGKPIKGLEWPGLWNGAMAHWITLFVEVPMETFNPVKELKDLFRSTHR
jgi:hypothetical protein